jgi:uncharacterized protein with NAD-binding domain and iron-sulfur cluster
MPESAAPRQKIAILGGGAGALAAAFGITQMPGWQDRYDITVYQVGWRLGGKGASGRNRAANDRIEEHGLHVWGGFYENAFLLMRKCYEQLARPADRPLATVWDAFKQQSNITITQKNGDGWDLVNLDLPVDPDARPGSDGELPSIWRYIQLVLAWMDQLLDDLKGETTAEATVLHSSFFSELIATGERRWEAIWSRRESLLTRLTGTLESGLFAAAQTVVVALRRVAEGLPQDVFAHAARSHRVLEVLLGHFKDHL